MKQVFMGGCQSTVATTRYMYLDGGYAETDNTREFREMLMMESGVLSFLRVDVPVAPGVGTARVFTVLKNNVATTLTVTIADANTTASDTTHTVSYIAGDLLVLRQTHTGAPAAAAPRWTVVSECTTPQRALWGTATDATITHTTGTRFAPAGGNGQDAFAAGGSDAAFSVPWGVAATIRTLGVTLAAAPGAGTSRAFDLMVNGVAQGTTVTISDTATTGTATGMSIAVAATDTVSIRETATNSPSNFSAAYGLSYTPTTDGQWNVSGRVQSDPTDGDYGPLGYWKTPTATEANTVALAVSADPDMASWTLSNMYVSTEIAPSGAETRVVTLRKSAVSTALAITLTGTATTGTDSDTVTVGANDYFAILYNKSAGAAGSAYTKWTFRASASTTAVLVVTGTVVPTATEQEIRDGAQTIILTLTGRTWETTMGDCNEITERLIDNLASDLWENLGWNNIVRGGVSYEDAVLGDTPLAYWRLGDTTDTSGGGYTIDTVGSGVTQDVTGLLTRSYNEAMSFDGINAGLTINDVAALRNIFDGGGAAEAVIRPLSDGEDDNGRIVSKGNIWALYLSNQSGGLVKLNFRQEFSGTAGNWQTTEGALALGARSHVAVVYNSDATTNDPTFYINGYEYSVANGRLTETATGTGTRTTDSGEAVYIGGFGADVLRFRGVIDEVALYSSSITQTDVIDHLHAASNPFGLTCNDVVRTSDTVVTITMPAFPIYDITATETITVTAPAETHSGSADITGTPTFQIVTDGVRTIQFDPPPGPGTGSNGGGSGGGTPNPGGGGDPGNPGGGFEPPGGGGGVEPPPFEGGNGGLGPPAPGVNTDDDPDSWSWGLDGLDVGLGVATQRRGRLLRIEIAEISPT